jgi:hypothetical protein
MFSYFDKSAVDRQRRISTCLYERDRLPHQGECDDRGRSLKGLESVK